jgi:PAS domain S-box-containing protein
MGERFPALGDGYQPLGDAPEGGEPPAEGQPASTAPVEAAAPNGHSRDPVFILRETGEILFANCSLGDRTEDEVIGTNILDWVPADQHDGIVKVLELAFETGETQRLELSGLQRNTDVAWYDCRVTPNVRDQKVVSATLVAHDITQYRQTLERLEVSQRELEQTLEERTADLARANAAMADEDRTRDEWAGEWARFRALMDQAGEAIFVTDPRTERVIDVNETAARWLGRMPNDVIGARLHELHLEFPVQPPVEVELEWTETRDTRRPLVLRGTHRRVDGTSFPVEVAVARHTLGAEQFVLAVARDMKGRVDAEVRLQESEQRFRGLFEQCWDAIYLTARNGEVEDINSAAIELFGYTREEFVGLDARQLFARSMDIKRFQVQMKTLGAVGDLEVELLGKDGVSFEALLSATWRPTVDGTIQGYQVIVRPVGLPVMTATASNAPEQKTERTRPSPALSAESKLSGTVVIAKGSAGDLADAADALFAAGMRVLTADTQEAAIELLHMHGESIDAAVFDADQVGGGLREALEEARRYAPDTGIIVVTEDEPVEIAESVADLGIQTILRKPIHPLALIQKIREL